MLLFKAIGALGLVFIILGFLLKKNKKLFDIFYLIGGICLEIYSIYIGDMIFIVLQAVFIVIVLIDILNWKKK